MNFVMTLLQNWKTTSAGISAIVAGTALISHGSIWEGLAGISTGLGLIAAKDAAKQ